jgi:CRISPR-associated protein Cas2
MVVLMLENAKASLRGELTRWLLEPRAGVFVGSVSALVREKLWEKVCRASPEGGAMLLYRAQTEQGYRIETYGETQRKIVDMEGLQLVYVPKKGKHKWR